MANISPKAIVDEAATLADDVVVGPFSYIGPEVNLERGCVIGNTVTIAGRTRLGPQNRVFPMAVIGAEDPGNPDGVGACELGPANMIREHVTIYAGVESPTRVGSDNLVMIGSQLGPGCSVGDHGIFANYTQIGGAAVIKDYVRSAGFSLIEPGVRVGAYTFTAGYAGVDQDAPPFAIVQGFPFRVRGVNSHNLRQCGFDDGDIRALKAAFRELFNGATRGADDEVIRRLAGRDDLNPHVRRLVAVLGGGDS